jgi:hypothetical protein
MSADVQRIRAEVVQAKAHFPQVGFADGSCLLVQAALQTSVGKIYVAELELANYPIQMPKAFIRAPKLELSPHKYKAGNICYLHPNMWNPGRHNLSFVLARVAKWLNKYDIYRATRRWVGAELEH